MRLLTSDRMKFHANKNGTMGAISSKPIPIRAAYLSTQAAIRSPRPSESRLSSRPATEPPGDERELKPRIAADHRAEREEDRINQRERITQVCERAHLPASRRISARDLNLAIRKFQSCVPVHGCSVAARHSGQKTIGRFIGLERAGHREVVAQRAAPRFEHLRFVKSLAANRGAAAPAEIFARLPSIVAIAAFHAEASALENPPAPNCPLGIIHR